MIISIRYYLRIKAMYSLSKCSSDCMFVYRDNYSFVTFLDSSSALEAIEGG